MTSTGNNGKLVNYGTLLQASANNQTVLSVNSNLSLQVNDYVLAAGYLIDGNGHTGVIGVAGAAFTGYANYCGAQAIIDSIYVANCDIGFSFGSTQFMRAYKLQAYNCSTGIMLINDATSGGGNSNDFYQPHVVNNVVGVFVDGTAYSTTPITSINFYNPQCLANSVCGMAFFTAQASIYGGAPEANGSGSATATVNGKTVKRSSMYLNNSTVNLVNFSVHEALADPCFLLENGSRLNCINVRWYGNTSGRLVSADDSSGVNFVGNYACNGSVQNVLAWPDSINPDIQSCLYGTPGVKSEPLLASALYANQSLSDVYLSGVDPPTKSFVTDSQLGSCVQVTFRAEAGVATGPNTVYILTGNTAASGPIVISCLLKATADTIVGLSCIMNGSSAWAGGFQGGINLKAGAPVRVVILTNACVNANPVRVFLYPQGTDGPVVKVSNMQVYQGKSYTDIGSLGDINKIVKYGAFAG